MRIKLYIISHISSQNEYTHEFLCIQTHQVELINDSGTLFEHFPSCSKCHKQKSRKKIMLTEI